MEQIINQILNNFDFAFMVIINVLTYIIIKCIDYFNGDKKVSVIVKRLCLIISIIIVFNIYLINGYDNNIILINSAIVSPVAWSWIFKPICVKLNINYKQDKTN